LAATADYFRLFLCPAFSSHPLWMALPPAFGSDPLWLALPPSFGSDPLLLALPPSHIFSGPPSAFPPSRNILAGARGGSTNALTDRAQIVYSLQPRPRDR
jgi:hypothetical protein